MRLEMLWTRSIQEIYLAEINGQAELPKKFFIYIIRFWESYMRLSSNKGDGEMSSYLE